MTDEEMLEQMEPIPEIGEEVEVQTSQHDNNLAALVDQVIPAEQERRTGRPKQYSARYQAYRQSLDRPLAKLGLLGMLLAILIVIFVLT